MSSPESPESPESPAVIRQPPMLPPLRLRPSHPLRPLPPPPPGRPSERPSGRPPRIRLNTSSVRESARLVEEPQSLSYRDYSRHTHPGIFSEKKDNYEIFCETNYLQFTKVFFPLIMYQDNSLNLDKLNEILHLFLKTLIDNVFTKDYYNNILTTESFDTVIHNIKSLINPLSLLLDDLDQRKKNIHEQLQQLKDIVTFIYNYVKSKQLLQALASISINDETDNFISFASFLIPHKDFINDIYVSEIIREILIYYDSFIINHSSSITEESKHELRLSIKRLKHVILFLKQIEKLLDDYLPKIKENQIPRNNTVILSLHTVLLERNKESNTRQLIETVESSSISKGKLIDQLDETIRNTFNDIHSKVIRNMYVGDELTKMEYNFMPRSREATSLYKSINDSRQVGMRMEDLRKSITQEVSIIRDRQMKK